MLSNRIAVEVKLVAHPVGRATIWVKELRHDMGQFHKWSRLRNCFGMRGGNAAWPKSKIGEVFTQV